MDDEKNGLDEEFPEEDFAAMLEESMVGSVQLEPGQKIPAKVLQIGADCIFLDVGQKGEGVLDTKELRDAEGRLIED